MELTDWLALYGAILSSIVALLSWHQAMPRVKVRVMFAADGSGLDMRSGVGIFVYNPTAQAAHITHIGFVYPWRQVSLTERLEHLLRYRRLPIRTGWCHAALSLHEVESGCPISIQPFQSHYVFVPETAIDHLLRHATRREFRVDVQDALHRTTFSPTFRVDWPLSDQATA